MRKSSKKPSAPALTCIVGNTTSELSQRERELMTFFRTMHPEDADIIFRVMKESSFEHVNSKRSFRVIAGGAER